MPPRVIASCLILSDRLSQAARHGGYPQADRARVPKRAATGVRGAWLTPALGHTQGGADDRRNVASDPRVANMRQVILLRGRRASARSIGQQQRQAHCGVVPACPGRGCPAMGMVSIPA